MTKSLVRYFPTERVCMKVSSIVTLQFAMPTSHRLQSVAEWNVSILVSVKGDLIGKLP